MYLKGNVIKIWACCTAMAITSGCGLPTSTVQTAVCTTPTLTTTQSGAPNFTLVPASTDFNIYPGQTEQISVSIQPIGNATGIVQLGGQTNTQGLTFAKTSAAIGTTATLTVTASKTVASDCFTGASGVYTASSAVNLTGFTNTGSVSTQVAMNVVLENPSFVPKSTNLPIMTINTVDSAPINSEDDYVDATISIVDAANPSNNLTTTTTEIKGHGNSTWTMPKKPYRLNLDSKAPLLGMTSDTNWILLANYDDKAMLRNDVSFKMSQMFGLAWTPNSAFTELFLNGVYQGTYQLTEKVEVSKERLDIGSMDDTDISGDDLTGGYLGEIDHTDGETFFLTSMVGLPIGIADPDPPAIEQSTYFTWVFHTAEASMYAPNFTDPNAGWQAYWDKSSLVNWFLVEELAGNQDADDWSSDYFYKPRSDPRFYRGPVWDMDITMGNDSEGAIAAPNVPWVKTQSLWYVQLFKDPAFLAAVKAQWTAIRPQVLTLPAYIDTRSAALSLTATNNYSRWPILGEKVWPNVTAEGSYSGEVEFMKDWLNERIAYMDANYLNK